MDVMGGMGGDAGEGTGCVGDEDAQPFMKTSAAPKIVNARVI